MDTTPELQIRGGIEDNSKIIFLFLNENICCDHSLELSRHVSSILMMGHIIHFNGAIWNIIPKLFLLPLLILITSTHYNHCTET